MVLHANQREADFLAAFLAGGDALFAGAFLFAVLLAVLPTIFLIGTFFTTDLAAVLRAVLADVFETDLAAVLVGVFVATLATGFLIGLLAVLVTFSVVAFSAGAFLAAAFAAGAGLDPTRCPFTKDGLAPLDKRLAAPNFTSLSPQISSRR